jgi:hypothetical protein
MERCALLFLAANFHRGARIMRIVVFAESLMPCHLQEITTVARAQQTKIRRVPKKHLTRRAIM